MLTVDIYLVCQIYAVYRKQLFKTNRVQQNVECLYNKYSNNQIMFKMFYLLNIYFMRVLNCAHEIDTASVCQNLSVLKRFSDSLVYVPL